ncbi:unnamed protein product [Lota lota]
MDREYRGGSDSGRRRTPVEALRWICDWRTRTQTVECDHQSNLQTESRKSEAVLRRQEFSRSAPPDVQQKSQEPEDAKP